MTINQGILLNQQSLDMYQKNIDAELNLLPGHWFQPYLAFGQYSNSGTGITDYVVQFNQYALPYNSSSHDGQLSRRHPFGVFEVARNAGAGWYDLLGEPADFLGGPEFRQ